MDSKPHGPASFLASGEETPGGKSLGAFHTEKRGVQLDLAALRFLVQRQTPSAGNAALVAHINGGFRNLDDIGNGLNPAKRLNKFFDFCDHAPRLSHRVIVVKHHVTGLDRYMVWAHVGHMIDSPEVIGRRLKALRESHQLSQDRFSESIGISQPRYAQYEKGTRSLTLEVAAFVCTTYGVTLDWLYFGDRSGLPLRLQSVADHAA